MSGNTTASSQTSDGRYVSAISVFFAALLLYYFTLAPTVTLIDSGELIVAAHTLGVAHPPGFPLYVILAHAFSHLPIDEIAYRVNFASAVFGAAAVGLMVLLVGEAMHGSCENSGKKRDDPKAGRAGFTVTVGPAVFAGLLFASSRTLWAYATIAEVYALNALLIASVLWLMLAWRRRRHAAVPEEKRGNGRLYVAALVFGLALGVHHVTVALVFPGLAAFVLLTEGPGFFRSRGFLVAALIAGLAATSVYLYLPIAASRSPLMNWGDPDTPQRFWWHVSGRQYQAFFEFSIWRIGELGNLLVKEFAFAWAGLGLAALGFARLFRRDKALFWLLTLVFAADTVYCLSYEIAEDKDAYYLPAFITVVIAAGFGARVIIQAVSTISRWPQRFVGTGLLIVPLIAAAGNYSVNDRSHHYIARDYVDNIFRSVEPNGMLLTADWQVYSPMLYERGILERRSDIIAINMNQLRRSWYYDYLDRSYPEMMDRSRDKVDAFLEDLRAWEENPAAYTTPVALNRLNSRFYDMLSAFVGNHIRRAPVYVTSEIVIQRGGQDEPFFNSLVANYRLVPTGMVFRVGEKGAPMRLLEPEITTRGLAEAAIRLDESDVVRQKVVPAYLNMLTNNGLYQTAQGNREQAVRYFERALALDPAFEPARRALAMSRQEHQAPQPQ